MVTKNIIIFLEFVVIILYYILFGNMIFIRYRLQKGLRQFGRMAKGFLTNDAIVIGVETRTSSPVRIPRDNESLQHVVLFGLYPCGEGAGYAGGIVSAAIDGERCADQRAQTLS